MVEDDGKGGRELQELGRGKHIQNLKSQGTGKGIDMDPGWQGEGPSLWLWAGSSPYGAATPETLWRPSAFSTTAAA